MMDQVDSLIGPPSAPAPVLSFLPQIISFTAGFATALFAEPLRQRLFAPRLSMSFGSSEDYVTRTPELIRMHDQDPGSEGQATYIRLKVQNESFRLARSCKAFLTGLEAANDKGQFHQTEYCDSIQLAWSVRGSARYDPQDLARSVPYFIDLLSFRDGTDIFQPHVRDLPFRYNRLFAQRGLFRYTIQVAGDGVRPATIRIEVDWRGDRSTLSARRAA